MDSVKHEAPLTDQMILDLLGETVVEKQIAVARQLTTRYIEKRLTPGQRKTIELVFRHLMRDAEIAVRRTLSEMLMENEDIPHDIAFAMAMDVAEVSLPVLKASHVLTDDDLIQVIYNTTETLKHIAIAQRDAVSETISAALVETKNEEVVGHLLGNEGAQFSETTVDKIVADFPDNVVIADGLIAHIAIPPTVIEKIMATASQALRSHLEAKYDALLHGAPEDTLDQNEALNTIALLRHDATDKEIQYMINHLYHHGRLTHAIVTTSLCLGKLRFFEMGLAKLAGIPYSNAAILIKDESNKGFEALYDLAGFPRPLFEAISLVLEITRSMEKDGTIVQDNGQSTNLSHLLTQLLNHTQAQKIEGMSTVLDVIRQSVSYGTPHHIPASFAKATIRSGNC